MPLRFLLVAAAACSLAAASDAQTGAKSPVHVHFGGVIVNAGYSRGFGWYPGPWGYDPYYYVDPLLWTPFYYPGFYNGFLFGPGMGNVKVQAGPKTAAIYLDGAYAGRRDELRNMWLQPGVYSLEIRDGQRRLSQKIYVLSGKTLRITPATLNQEVLP